VSYSFAWLDVQAPPGDWGSYSFLGYSCPTRGQDEGVLNRGHGPQYLKDLLVYGFCLPVLRREDSEDVVEDTVEKGFYQHALVQVVVGEDPGEAVGGGHHASHGSLVRSGVGQPFFKGDLNS